MNYTEIKIITQQENLDAILTRLYDLGIYDAIINDPDEFQGMLDNLNETEWYNEEDVDEDWKGALKEPPSITIYSTNDGEGSSRLNLVKEAFAEACATDEVELVISNKSDVDWKDKWKEYYFPAKITDRIVVSPSWATDEDIEKLGTLPTDSIIVRIDPGQAFGTGTHETTSLTIRLMEKYIQPGNKVLDIGTGSGILAIIAARLGAAEILGVDIDEESVKVAKENIALNLGEGVLQPSSTTTSHVDAILGDLTQGVDFTADVIVANLLHDLVIRLSKDAAKHLIPGGIYISSGILTEKEPLVAEAIREAGFDILEIIRDGEWSAIAAKAKPSV